MFRSKNKKKVDLQSNTLEGECQEKKRVYKEWIQHQCSELHFSFNPIECGVLENTDQGVRSFVF
jgi:hypothetical protein